MGVEFVEEIRGGAEKADMFFVHEDPARVYRGLKDLLVDEFDMDRIVEGQMEHNMKKPKDRIRMHAFKEKSPYTVIHYSIQFKAKEPRDLYKYERDDDILKARVKTSGEVITVYPGGDTISWLPKQLTVYPDINTDHSGLEWEDEHKYHDSKLYKMMAGIWYHKFYSKEIEKYAEEGRETMKRIHNLMRERFGVEKSIERTGASHYQPPWQ